MRSRNEIQALFEEFRRGLCRRLLEEGWTRRERVPCEPLSLFSAGHLGTFARPLNDEFLAAAIFSWTREDESSPLVVVAHVGLEYGPASGLLAALTDPEVTGLVLSGPHAVCEIFAASDIRQAVTQLGLFARNQATHLAHVRTIDTVLELLSDHRAIALTDTTPGSLAVDVVSEQAGAGQQVEFEENLDNEEESPADAHAKLAEAELIAALLATAGRYDEARSALLDYQPSNAYEHLGLKYRRFVRQLTPFLDSRGECPLPRSPPRWPPSAARPEPRPSLPQVLMEIMPEARARQEAVEAVRAVSLGNTREELRELLTEQLNKRGVKIDPLALETTVDLLATEVEPFGKARIVLRALKALRRLASSCRNPLEMAPVRAPRAREAGTDTVPELKPTWLQMPDRAAYPISGSYRRFVAVTLDPAAAMWLDRALPRGSSGFERAGRMVPVWLTRDTESTPVPGGLNVHIGAERVGHVEAEVAKPFRPAMEAAAERDEDPWTHARLTRTSGETPYALELALPQHGSE